MASFSIVSTAAAFAALGQREEWDRSMSRRSIHRPAQGWASRLTSGTIVGNRPRDSRGNATAMKRMTALVGAMCLATLVGCGPDADPAPGRTTTSTPTGTTSPSPTATIDPRAQPAVDAYLAFYRTSKVSATKPPGLEGKLPAGGDFTKFSVDPVKSDTRRSLFKLNEAGRALRGSQPIPRPRVDSIELTAKPYPRVVITDCAEWKEAWVLTDIKSGKPVDVHPPAIAAPYEDTVTVIQYQGRWSVQKIVSDTSRTCSP